MIKSGIDVVLADSVNIGLTATSKVRLKVFTLDRRVIKKRIGTLPNSDISKVKENLIALLFIGAVMKYYDICQSMTHFGVSD